MSLTVPYNPSLMIGNIISQESFENILEINNLQVQVDNAESKLHSLIALKESLDMTLQELLSMEVNVDELAKEQKGIEQEIQQAAIEYGKIKVATQKQIQPLKANVKMTHESMESPLDLQRSQLKQLPLSSDSLNLNSQYFSYNKNRQESNAHTSSVSDFVGASLKKTLGKDYAKEASSHAQSQMKNQHARHDIEGTLVVSINCTHKNAQIFSPAFLDPDKSINAWNKIFPDDSIVTEPPTAILNLKKTKSQKEEKSFSILSGATYGSAFIALVHFIKSANTNSKQLNTSEFDALQKNLDEGAWLAGAEGRFGVDESVTEGVKSLLSIYELQTHCSIVTLGVIPSIKSNEVKVAIKEFADFDPAKIMESLTLLHNSASSEQNSIGKLAAASRTGKEMISLESAKVKSTLLGLSEISQKQNRIIDVNSMISALDDYVSRCVSGGDNIGVPINYYLKPISKSEIVRAWLEKYHNNEKSSGIGKK